jgi:hypothetical protein
LVQPWSFRWRILVQPWSFRWVDSRSVWRLKIKLCCSGWCRRGATGSDGWLPWRSGWVDELWWRVGTMLEGWRCCGQNK